MYALSAQQCIDAGQQFPRIKGFRQVVIGAGVQPCHSIVQFRSGRQHQDGHFHPPFPKPPGHLITVPLRHHHVQDQQVINSQRSIILTGFAVAGGIGFEAILLKQGFKRIGQQFFIFYNQDSHDAFYLQCSVLLYYIKILK